MRNAAIARIAAGVAIVAAVLFVGGPIAIRVGLLDPGPGFYTFGLGLLVGLLALPLGLLALWLTRPATGRGGRGLAAFATVVGIALVSIAAIGAGSGRGAPPINDITTSPGDPPLYVEALRDPANAGDDMIYPGEVFAAQQRAGYPDLAPIRTSLPPDLALARSVDAMESFGWSVTASDPADGRAEATDTSAVFRFVDDVVVRVRPAADGGSVIDVRSRSRVGRGDLGANAARIRRLSGALSGS